MKESLKLVFVLAVICTVAGLALAVVYNLTYEIKRRLTDQLLKGFYIEISKSIFGPTIFIAWNNSEAKCSATISTYAEFNQSTQKWRIFTID